MCHTELHVAKTQMMADDIGKQRLRPFLEAQINNGKIAGLCWMNNQKTKFRIPWWHGGKPEWNPECGQIFKVASHCFICRCISPVPLVCQLFSLHVLFPPGAY